MTVASTDRKTDVLFIRGVNKKTRQFIEDYQAEHSLDSISAAVRDLLHKAHVEHVLTEAGI